MTIESPALTDSPDLKKPLSVAVVETIFLAFTLGLGLETAFTLIAQQFGISFQAFIFISPMMIGIGLIGAAWLQWKVLRQVEISDKRILGGLILVGLLLALLPLITNHPTTDDFYYIPNVIYFLKHPAQPMDFQMHFLFGANNKPIISQSQATSVAYDYFRAVVARYLKLDFLTIYFRFGMLTGFLVPFAYFLLISRFIADTRRAFESTIVAISLLLVSMEGPRTFGIITFWDAHLGKLILFSIGFPLFAAFSISFLKNPSFKDWILLFACTTTMVGMTSSATTLLPALAVVLFAAFALTVWLDSGYDLKWKELILRGCFYFASLGYAVAYALFLYAQLKRGNTTANPFDLAGQNGFLNNLFYFSSPYVPITFTLIILSIIAVCIFVRGWQRVFLLAWIAFLFLTFLNPLAVPLVINTIMPPSIYWRMFYLMPFPLMASIAAASVPIYKVLHKVRYALLPIALAIYLLVTYQQGYLSFSLDQLPVQNLNIAREISHAAPKGLMLAPSKLSGPITMVSGDQPQVITLQVALAYWLDPLGQEKDVAARSAVDQFLTNVNQDSRAMINLVDANPQIRSIVLSKNTVTKNAALMKILVGNGFTKSLVIHDYILVWK